MPVRTNRSATEPYLPEVPEELTGPLRARSETFEARRTERELLVKELYRRGYRPVELGRAFKIAPSSVVGILGSTTASPAVQLRGRL